MDNKKRILILLANPLDTARINLAKEVKGIEKILQESGRRDEYQLQRVGRHAGSLA
jgi:hypothetical protein